MTATSHRASSDTGSTRRVAASFEEEDFVRGRPKVSSAATPAAGAARTPSRPVADGDGDVLFRSRSQTPAKSKANNKTGTDRSKTVAASAMKSKKSSPNRKSNSGASDKGGETPLVVAKTKISKSKISKLIDSTVDSLTNRVPKRAETLGFKKLRVGMVMLGCVRSVGELDLTINLPHSLTGFASLREVSDGMAELVDAYLKKEDDEAAAEDDDSLPELSALFQPGHVVRCAVVGLDQSPKGHRIELSMRPSLINKGLSVEKLHVGMGVYGAVRSVEEKGYVVDLGLPNANVFLPFSEAPSSSSSSSSAAAAQLIVGQQVECVVSDPPTARVIKLSADAAKVAEAVTAESTTHPLSFTDLKAGLLVDATVKRVLPTGLWLQFLSVFTGTVDLLHLEEPAGADWAGRYSEGQRLRARVLFVDFEAKRLALTVRPNLLRMAPHAFPAALAVGAVLPEAAVLRVESGMGLFLTAQWPEPTADANAKASKTKSKSDAAAAPTPVTVPLFAHVRMYHIHTVCVCVCVCV